MWYGALVRAELWEPRHTQDILPSKDDRQELNDARPDGLLPPQGPPLNIDDLI